MAAHTHPDLPEHEWRTLRTTVEGAEELAAEGEVESARECLVAGVGRAERLRRAGEPWGVALRREYQQALERLEQRYPAQPHPADQDRSASAPTQSTAQSEANQP